MEDQHNVCPVCREYDTWVLSQQDSKAFINALLISPEPNETLKAAAAHYKVRKLGSLV